MNVLLGLFFVGCLTINLWALSLGWSHTILDWHEFRQTQTAISTFWMLHGGPWIAYETPVLGPPWSIPFEFPLYQWTVAWAVRLLSLPLDQAGRLVSATYFYLTLPPAYFVLGRFGVRPVHRLVFIALLLVSPLYLFWSRTFMIESTGVCLGMAYLAATLAFVERRTAWWGALAAVTGALAGMVKVTTYVGFLLAASLVVLRAGRRVRPSVRQLSAAAAAVFGVPVVMTMLWTAFAEVHRAANPVAFALSSQLTNWIFGSLALRSEMGFWQVLVQRTVPEAVGHWGLVACSVGGLILTRRRWREAVLCLGLFLSAPLIFANLHYVHNYYAYANALFLVAGVGFATVSLLERSGWRRIAGVALALGVAWAEVLSYARGYYEVQRQDHPLPLGAVLRRVTAPDDVLLIYGEDWSPELPYYAQRRALMDRNNRSFSDPTMRAAMENLKTHHVGAGVFCRASRSRTDLVRQAQQAFELLKVPFVGTGGCDVYLERQTAAAEAAWEEETVRAGLEALYARRDPAQAAVHFATVLERNPKHYGATYQLATALDASGKREEAQRYWERVLWMAVEFNDRATVGTARARMGIAAMTVEALMQAGLDALYKRRDGDTAVVYFRVLLERNPQHYGATYQLAAALDAAGKPDEARSLWERVLAMAEASNDPPTVATARTRLAQE
ncbi:MAG TPA: tetratricopeptide repeat protein [Candidatus Dormibacteraeota bacterium]|nr:tetratricopeptide repeat protein [Candidatus Dormibacteraeota bacterium]